MIAIEKIRKVLEHIAARTHGQVGGVRHFQGRHLYFMKESTPIMLLPSIASDDLMQNSGVNLGKFYSMVDLDGVDSPDAIVQ